MSDTGRLDPASVFAMVDDPQYNAVRLFLTIDEATKEVRANVGAGDQTPESEGNADLGGGTERN